MRNRIMFVARVRSQLVDSWCCSQGSFRPNTSEQAQQLHRLKSVNLCAGGFTLVEVGLALGVIAFAVTTILALFPVALTTGHSAQDATRAPHIAQAIIASVASQAQTQFNNVQLRLGDNTTLTVDLTAPSSSPTTPTLYADNDGNTLSATSQNAAVAAYAIYFFTN